MMPRRITMPSPYGLPRAPCASPTKPPDQQIPVQRVARLDVNATYSSMKQRSGT